MCDFYFLRVSGLDLQIFLHIFKPRNLFQLKRGMYTLLVVSNDLANTYQELRTVSGVLCMLTYYINSTNIYWLPAL